MTQSTIGEPEAAGDRTEQTKSFVRRVRTVTRCRYSPEKKIRIVLLLVYLRPANQDRKVARCRWRSAAGGARIWHPNGDPAVGTLRR